MIKKLRSRSGILSVPPGGGGEEQPLYALCVPAGFTLSLRSDPDSTRDRSAGSIARERLNSPGENGNRAGETHQS